uniref:Uncharacterized protein n=1 Tax=Oryza sativa subsp. japonica TaxID=39947 RepID=Q6H5X1_ORYSJ|nr:hypothetical protein [Oryza sativa Japonica Group]BAD25878.1 hypothetical protein [Oryza sativa Japonica Group]
MSSPPSESHGPETTTRAPDEAAEPTWHEHLEGTPSPVRSLVPLRAPLLYGHGGHRH